MSGCRTGGWKPILSSTEGNGTCAELFSRGGSRNDGIQPPSSPSPLPAKMPKPPEGAPAKMPKPASLELPRRPGFPPTSAASAACDGARADPPVTSDGCVCTETLAFGKSACKISTPPASGGLSVWSRLPKPTPKPPPRKPPERLGGLPNGSDSLSCALPTAPGQEPAPIAVAKEAFALPRWGSRRFFRPPTGPPLSTL